jgi:hypothetical protein
MYVGNIVFEKNENEPNWAKLLKLCFLSLLSLFSQNNGRRQLLLQNYIILEIIIKN